jgi:hypothetical protein
MTTDRHCWSALDLSAIPERVRMALTVVAATNGISVEEFISAAVLVAFNQSGGELVLPSALQKCKREKRKFPV